jgi:DNA gyrase/topoisomerase IV subunit B
MESTCEHGTHVEGMLHGIADAVAAALPSDPRDTRRLPDALGLHAVVHVNVADPKFDQPTKDKLASPEVVGAVRAVVAERLTSFLLERPDLRASLAARLGRRA